MGINKKFLSIVDPYERLSEEKDGLYVVLSFPILLACFFVVLGMLFNIVVL
jgi:hypothetical protein